MTLCTFWLLIKREQNTHVSFKNASASRLSLFICFYWTFNISTAYKKTKYFCSKFILFFSKKLLHEKRISSNSDWKLNRAMLGNTFSFEIVYKSNKTVIIVWMKLKDWSPEVFHCTPSIRFWSYNTD